MEWLETDSNNDLKTAVCARPTHQTGITSRILWVAVLYAPSGTTGEASQTGLDRGHNAGMGYSSPHLSLFGRFSFFLLSPPFSLFIHSLSDFHTKFHYIPYSCACHFQAHITPYHFPLLCCPPPSLPYFLPTNPQLVLSFLILHSSALLFTPQAYVHSHTKSLSRFPFCFSNSSFQNMPQLYNHNSAICTCLP